MSEIKMLQEPGVKEQNDFIVDKYNKFLMNATYGYLFEGLNLREIEFEYLGSQELQGFFAKGVLNMIGIDTSLTAHNMGRFKGKDVRDVSKSLMQSNDIRLNNIGRIISDF